MKTPEYPEKQQNLDQFIEKVEQLERKRRRHIGQISLITLAVLGGISTLFWQMIESGVSQKPETFRTFFTSELNPENIRMLFKEGKQRIIVRYDESAEADTISNVKEYLEIFHPFSNSPVVQGSIVSNRSNSGEEWDYENGGATKAGEGDSYFFDNAQTEEADDPWIYDVSDDSGETPKKKAGSTHTDIQPTLLTLSKSIKPVNNPNGASELPTEAQTPEKSNDKLPVASTGSPTDTRQTSQTTQGASRARNIPAVHSNQAKNSAGQLESEPASSTMPGVQEALEIADRMPAFPGGTAALQQFLDARLTYPVEAREREVEGKVYIRFIVNADGSLTDFKLLRGIGYGCDEEAMRVAQSLPKWIPGRQGLTRVPVKYTLPIRFKLK